MERITLFADILLPLPIKGTFTYRVPFELNALVKPGQRVAVQFGKKKVYAGLIRRLHEKVPEYTPKYIIHLLDKKPLVNEIQFQFWEWMAAYYMSTEGEVMNAALPSAFKLESESKVLLSPSFTPDQAILDEYEFRITEALLEKKRLSIDEIAKQVGFQKVLPLLKNMIDKKMLMMEEALEDSLKPKMEKFISLNAAFEDEENISLLMDELGKRAHKQLQLLVAYLQLARFSGLKTDEISKTSLLKKSDCSDSQLKALIDKGVFEVTERPVSRFDSKINSAVSGDIVLSSHQEEALQQIQTQFENHNVVLLHGVTSGGKTEMYIKLIEETLQKGKRVLYLLPEIALTTHIITRLRKYFGNEIGVYHSKYNSDERAEVWDNIANREEHKIHAPFKIILGPRSAIFLPFDNLGLIIIDEEHDQSYKQFDPAPRYNARDAAIYLATLHTAKVLLGSATPSLESYFNARRGKYGLVQLTERYGGVEMPKIEIVDMRDEMRRRLLQSHFSSVLMNGIKDALEKKQQVILFQNRRGFSLRIECEQCNWVPQCRNCDVTLTYHKNSDLLKCHYCGYSTTVPPSCSNCGSPNLKMVGFGTEKVAEELGILLPDAKIDRMDLDSTRSKNAFQRIFSDFENQKTDILAGTQMVTKGLDFDNVQVVGILNADNMLSFPDFRAHERSYQLMSQVSGRAGRKDKQGNVIIQAWQPNHPIIQQVVETDFENMAETQLAEREKFHYPPFYRLINIKMKHKNAELLFDASVFLGKELRARFGNRVLGPEYPLVSRIRNLYIRQIMLKNPANSSQSELKEHVFEVLTAFRKIAKYKSVSIQFDVDPQ